jgi:hypothetical protein
MAGDLVTSLVPVLGRSSHDGFNVFDVMRHGTHEKQISNVFGWLLDADSTHGLGDRFQQIFIDAVNEDRIDADPFASESWVVRQEVNTSAAGDERDIADLVLDGEGQRLVVENYFTSDGHGHSYDGYLQFAQQEDRRGAVVLLCWDEDESLLADGWERASVVTYGRAISDLMSSLPGDYAQSHPDAHSFLTQMHIKFVAGRGPMPDQDVLDYLAVMCSTGEASRYQATNQEIARLKFGEDMAQQAEERFDEGRELLQRVKDRLRSYCDRVLRRQLDKELGKGFVSGVNVRLAGIYRWTVTLDISAGDHSDETTLQMKFGPSAWYANEADPYDWKSRAPTESADYSHLFLTARRRDITQSSVTLAEVLEGLTPDDSRLRDEFIELWRSGEEQSEPVEAGD